MKYKAIVVDLDGTVLDSPKEKLASHRLRSALGGLEKKGVKICVATGRAYTFAKPVIDSMGLVHPAIVSGGSRIVNPISGEQLWGRSLTQSQVNIVKRVFSDDTNLHFLVNEWTDEEYLGGAYKLDQLDSHDEVFIFVACFVEPHDVPRLLQNLRSIEGINAIVATSHAKGKNDIHVTHKDASKEHAVYELEKLINVSKSEMIGVGDGANDIHLFDAVGHKVAMGNAVDKLKNDADEVIGDVKEDGLAVYLEQLVDTLDKGCEA